jgi:hypothetical protein
MGRGYRGADMIYYISIEYSGFSGYLYMTKAPDGGIAFT